MTFVVRLTPLIILMVRKARVQVILMVLDNLTLILLLRGKQEVTATKYELVENSLYNFNAQKARGKNYRN